MDSPFRGDVVSDGGAAWAFSASFLRTDTVVTGLCSSKSIRISAQNWPQVYTIYYTLLPTIYTCGNICRCRQCLGLGKELCIYTDLIISIAEDLLQLE